MKKIAFTCFVIFMIFFNVNAYCNDDPFSIPQNISHVNQYGGCMTEDMLTGVTVPSIKKVRAKSVLSASTPTQTFEEYLNSKIALRETTIDVSVYNCTVSEMYTHIRNILYENPYTGMAARWAYETDTNDIVQTISPEYLYNSDDSYNQACIKLQQIINSIVNYAQVGQTDAQKALLAHDKIVLEFNYDPKTETSESGKINYSNLSYSPFGFVENKYAVCQAYSILYSAVLDSIGITNAYCQSDELNHVWNLIKIDNNWYHCDVTWGEVYGSGTDSEGNIVNNVLYPDFVNHDYFLVSNNIKGHEPSSGWKIYSTDEDVNCTSTEFEHDYIFNNNIFPIKIDNGVYSFERGGEKFYSNYFKGFNTFTTSLCYSSTYSEYRVYISTFEDADNVDVFIGYYDNNKQITRLAHNTISFRANDCIAIPIFIDKITNGCYAKIFAFNNNSMLPLCESPIIN